jgi:hypothetical protein
MADKVVKRINKNVNTKNTVFIDSDGTKWTQEDVEAYIDYCGIVEEQNKKGEKETMKMCKGRLVQTKDGKVTVENTYNHMNDFEYVIGVMEERGLEVAKKEVMDAKELDQAAFDMNICVDTVIDLYIAYEQDLKKTTEVVYRIGDKAHDPQDEIEEAFLTAIFPNWKELFEQVDKDMKEIKAEEEKVITEEPEVITKEPEVNTDVEKSKEEKNMTTTTNSIFGFIAQKMAETGHGFGEEKPTAYADDMSDIGMHIVKLKEMKLQLTKLPGNPDKGIAPEFHETLVIKFTENGEEMPLVFINNRNFLYSGKDKMNVNVTSFIPNNAYGTAGMYLVPKEEALEKKVEELNYQEDFNFYTLAEGQSVFSPVWAEYRAIARKLGIALMLPDNDGVFPIPEDLEIPIYVYESIIKQTTVKVIPAKKAGAKATKKEEIKEVAYYNVSFVSPNPNRPDGEKDKDGAYNAKKYGKYFTDSDDARHKAECLKQAGVQAYIESLAK